MVLESGYLGAHVSVVTLHSLGRETKIVLFASIAGEIIVGGATPGLQVIEVGRKVSVSAELTLRAANKLRLLSHFEVKGTGELSTFFVVTGLIITGTHKISCCSFISLRGTTQFKLTGISLFLKISSTLLGLIELVIG